MTSDFKIKCVCLRWLPVSRQGNVIPTGKAARHSRFHENYERTVEIIGGIILANIKSAKKRILVNRTKAARNKSIKSATKTAIKKVYAAIEAKDKEAAKAALLAATSTIDKAARKGVYHNNTASRKVSRLNLAVNKME